MALAGTILGLALGLQFRYATGVAASPDSQAAWLVNSVDRMQQERDRLQTQVNSLRQQLDDITDTTRIAGVQHDLEVARIEAGVDAVTGPGVTVTLNDSSQPFAPGQNPNLYVLHDVDVLRVLNEIKAAGGEAIAINGHRLLAGSSVRCIGPAILIDQTARVTPPYVIAAVGDPDTLAAALNMRGGVVDSLTFWGIRVTVQKAAQLTIPAYQGAVTFTYAKPGE